MKTKLINYLFENQVLGQSFNIYLYGEKLVHTLGSMEYRDEEHKYIGRFEFLNENSPYSKADVKRMVEVKIYQKQLFL